MTPRELEADLRAKVSQLKIGPTLASRSRADEKIDAAKLLDVMRALPSVLEGNPSRPAGKIARIEIRDVEYLWRSPEPHRDLLAPPKTWERVKGGVGWHAQVETRVTYRLPEGVDGYASNEREPTVFVYSHDVPTKTVKPYTDD